MGDSKMIQGAVQRSSHIYIVAEENSTKPQLGDHLIKTVQTVIASNGVTYFQIKSVESQSTSGRENEGKNLELF